VQQNEATKATKSN